MGVVHRFLAAIRNLLFKSRADQELNEELQSYVDLVADERRLAGADAATAARAGRMAVEGLEPTKEAVRQYRAGAGVERFVQDVRYALRGLRRSPGFATAAIVILALGIGANAAMFSVADAAMFKPLPYSHPEQLVQIAAVFNVGTAEETHQVGLSWKELDQWRAERQIFSEGATSGRVRVVTIPEIAASGPTFVGSVSPDLLELFGVRPRLGRWFVGDDVQSSRPVVLLTETVWKHAFGSDPRILGRTITIDRVPYTVVGIMPSTFMWAVGNPASTIGWVPFDEQAARLDPASHGATSTFRIRDGLTLSQAQRAAEVAASHMPRPSTGAVPGIELLPLDSRQISQGATRTALAVLLGVVGCVLLIACANVANLLLARAFTRQRELAVRAALGASRGRLIRQMLTEGLVLTSLGGAGGLMIAAALIAKIPVLVPAQLGLFYANPLALDTRVLAVCAAAVVLTALLCSLIPALRASRSDVIGALEGSARVAGASVSGRRVRHAMQAIEVALTMVLLAGLGLLVSSFVKMVWTPPGFDVDRLATAMVSLPRPRYPAPPVQREFFDTLLDHVRNLSGVRAAAYGTPPPGGGGGRFVPFGHEHDSTVGRPLLSLYNVDAEYFRIAGIAVKEGRLFNGDDGPTSPPVAIIDENAARVFWPGQSAIGQRFRYSPYVPWITVVGVAGHVKTRSFNAANGTVQAYMPTAQNSSTSSRALLMRLDGDPRTGLDGVRSILHTMDATINLQYAEPVADMYDDVFIAPRFYLLLMSIFAVLALITAAVGLFGTLNYSVSQRTREIGVRLTLGASMGSIRALVLRDALLPVAGGIAMGLAGALWLTRYLESMLYGVTPHDIRAYGSAIALLLIVAGVAIVLPARRATRVDPVTTLRAE